MIVIAPIGYAINGSSDGIAPTFGGIVSAINTGIFREVKLTWNLSLDSDVINYDIYYSTVNNAATILSEGIKASAPSSSNYIIIGGLTNTQYHYFIVRARDTAGNRDSNVNIIALQPTNGNLPETIKRPGRVR